VVVDELTSADGGHAYGFVLHGSSDGSVAAGRFDVDDINDLVTWTKASGVKLKAQFVAPAVTITNATMNSDATGKTEPYITATASGTNLRFLTLLTPLNTGQTAPQITKITSANFSACYMTSSTDTAIIQTKGGTAVENITSNFSTDARLALLKNKAGQFSFALITEGKELTYQGTMYLNSAVQVNAVIQADSAGYTLSLAGSTTTSPASITIGGLKAGHYYQVTSSNILATVYFKDSLVTDSDQLLKSDSTGKITVTQSLSRHQVVLVDKGTSAVSDRKIGNIIPANTLLLADPLEIGSAALNDLVRNHHIKLYDLSGRPMQAVSDLTSGMFIYQANGVFGKVIILK